MPTRASGRSRPEGPRRWQGVAQRHASDGYARCCCGLQATATETLATENPSRRGEDEYINGGVEDHLPWTEPGLWREGDVAREGLWRVGGRRQAGKLRMHAPRPHVYLRVGDSGLPSAESWGRDMENSWRCVFLLFPKKHGWGRDMGHSWRCS